MDLDAAIAFKGANKQQHNERGAAAKGAENNAADQFQQNELYSKFKAESFVVDNNDANLREVQQLAPAFYLPLKQEAGETWKAVLEALHSLKECDVSVADKYSAYGLQYHHDKFMLARTQICKIEGKGDDKFLEIHRLEGDGFVFSDNFKKNLVDQIGEYVQDVEAAEPQPLENEKDGFLNFLDLSDDAIAADMIQHWLATLKPKGGVKYNQGEVFQTLSSLGWNCNEENNLKTLADYNDHIVGPVMEILRHPEMTHVPTGYFGAMCIDRFVQADAIPKDMKTWASVLMLVEAMEKYCLPEDPKRVKNIDEMQVTRSGEVLRLLISILTKLAPEATGEQPDALAGKVETVLSGLSEVLEEKSITNLRGLFEAEEEVQAA